MSEYDTAEIQKLDAAHYMHPFTDHKALGEKGARVMVRGDGIYLWDSEGNKIFGSGVPADGDAAVL
jgi:putrescine aminotransferase